MTVPPPKSFRFVDDGFPEATEYDSNYVMSRGWTRVSRSNEQQPWFRRIMALLGRLSAVLGQV